MNRWGKWKIRLVPPNFWPIDFLIIFVITRLLIVASRYFQEYTLELVPEEGVLCLKNKQCQWQFWSNNTPQNWGLGIIVYNDEIFHNLNCDIGITYVLKLPVVVEIWLLQNTTSKIFNKLFRKIQELLHL